MKSYFLYSLSYELCFQINSAKEQMKSFKETQVVMTSSGRMISCQKIVHLKAKSSAGGWKRVIGKCLAEIEKYSFSSVAFPALGTGKSG